MSRAEILAIQQVIVAKDYHENRENELLVSQYKKRNERLRKQFERRGGRTEWI